MPTTLESFIPSEFPSSHTLRHPPMIADLKALSGFRALMAQQSHPVNIARMMFDRTYAYERIAVAHSCADAALQRMALQLFGQYLATDGSLH